MVALTQEDRRQSLHYVNNAAINVPINKINNLQGHEHKPVRDIGAPRGGDALAFRISPIFDLRHTSHKAHLLGFDITLWGGGVSAL